MKVQPAEAIPQAEFHFLETLWFQIAGTLCNLRCIHCFISCSPTNHSLEMMETGRVLELLEEAKGLGVKEIYYTGGEPFIHRDFLFLLERTLQDFPVSVLTNGLLIDDRKADQLQRMAEASRYSLELRISLDDHRPERNDTIRGRGTFEKALGAYRRLYDRGLLPILTVTEIHQYFHPEEAGLESFDNYVRLLKERGVERPRIKIIPVFEMGGLPEPGRPQLISGEMLQGFDHSLLQCSSSRVAAHDGVYACPILVGQKGAHMGSSLREALRPCSLYHSACHTCYATGMTCKNF